MKRKAILDKIYREVEAVILRRQHPVSGLFPASTSINSHGDYTDAWVRDNVYSIMAIWCLGMAYRRYGDKDRSDQLEQSTIKLMRGLLLSMMRQAQKVEKFKHTLAQKDALHAKYDTATGLEVVADDAWGHLQIDATSLFLLMLAQFTASGLRIVTTADEVDFVQNLVYYIASAYRIPDFGIWERGNKINNGKTEINASSVGMAKAALQALDGFNLFGKDASPRAVIHSVPDAISHARNTLAGLLPRESLSKETDSALLSIIGFPAFAVGDKILASKTRDDILAKLGGKYGCKRFLWDGHQTIVEESSRLYYEHSELANFEHIESEWPLFFTYLYIHALFDGNETTARFYRERLEGLMVEVDGFRLLPELYYVPAENIEKEKLNPRSQARIPNTNVPLVWAQSLYLVGLMLDEGLLQRDDIDPLKMRTRSRRFSNPQIALVVLAENNAVKQHLAEHGVLSETIQNIQPINVITAPCLVETYTYVGANAGLNLTGRPRRRLQSLATSQTYEINHKQCLCLSWIQSEHNDYRSYDAALMAKNIEREINHIRSHWLSPEVAVFTWMVDQHFCETRNVDVLYQTLRDLQLRTKSEFVGYASAKLAMRASRLNHLWVPDFCAMPISKDGFGSVTDKRFSDRSKLDERAQNLLECIDIEMEPTCYRTLDIFIQQHSMDGVLTGGELPVTVRELVQNVYHQAQTKGYWLVARKCYACLGQYPIDMADGLAVLAARHLAVVIGKDKINSITVDAPLQNEQIVEFINKLHFQPLERTLVQEFLAIIGTVLRIEPRLFDGLRSIQVHNLMLLCADASADVSEMELLMTLGAMSPSSMLERVWQILTAQHRIFTRGLKSGAYVGGEGTLTGGRGSIAVDTDWFEWRVARGSITRLDDELLKGIWQSIGCAHLLIFGDQSSQESILDCDLVRSSMTAGEASFGNLVDRVTQHLHPAYYKSAVLEALYGFTLFCASHPNARFDSPIIFSQVLERAAKSYIWDSGAAELGKRDLDVLLEQSPVVLQKYLVQVFEDIATIY
jgi:Glycosyl hydrolases family 15/Phosphorylase b kinase C-terminal domain